MLTTSRSIWIRILNSLGLCDAYAMTHTSAGTDSLLTELAKYAEVIHDALEIETCFDNRIHHLGHLAMAARMFIALQLSQSTVKLAPIYYIERSSVACKLPGDAAARIRVAWATFSPHLKQYLDAHGFTESNARNLGSSA